MKGQRASWLKGPFLASLINPSDTIVPSLGGDGWGRVSCTALPGASWGRLVVAQREEWAPRCLQAKGFIQSDGFIAGGLLLSDPQGCDQSPELGLQDGDSGCCPTVHSGQKRFTDALVDVESLDRC